MTRSACSICLATVVLITAGMSQTSKQISAAKAKPKTWTFVVSGDSRNCGDFVMPAIAEGAARHEAAFYWHLGDFRAMRGPDQDMLGELDASGKTRTLDLRAYQDQAWDDFLKMQVAPFEKRGIPVFLGIGNHELVPPKDRAQYIDKFSKWIDSPPIREQRNSAPGASSTVRTYYHWRQGGIDFISLDNASNDQFDTEQMAWFSRVVKQDRDDPAVSAIVVGMHKSLPDSFSNWHSMGESPEGIQSGRCAYKALVKAYREAHKPVYVLASHSHFYMPEIYDTPFWRSNPTSQQTVLPGWIIGTAGAVRLRLPQNSPQGARTDVYGYLLATVNAGGTPGAIRFEFKQIQKNKADGEDFIPEDVKRQFSKEAQQYCLEGNSDMHPAQTLVEPPDAPCVEPK